MRLISEAFFITMESAGIKMRAIHLFACLLHELLARRLYRSTGPCLTQRPLIRLFEILVSENCDVVAFRNLVGYRDTNSSRRKQKEKRRVGFVAKQVSSKV
jgi:hypothetical protein